MSYKLFIFSDVHGCYDKLLEALDKSCFEIENPNHILISCGDLFDRGTMNKEIYLFVEKMLNKKRFYGIRGNHDQMLLDIFLNPHATMNHYNNARYNGVYETLASLLDDNLANFNFLSGSAYVYARKRLLKLYPNLQNFLANQLVDQIIIDNNYLLVHAGYSFHPFKGWQVDCWTNTLEEFIDLYPYHHDKTIIFGHFWAAQLNKNFILKYAHYQIGNADLDFNIFKYKNYLGIDGYTNVTGIVNVITLNLDSLDKIVCTSL